MSATPALPPTQHGPSRRMLQPGAFSPAACFRPRGPSGPCGQQGQALPTGTASPAERRLSKTLSQSQKVSCFFSLQHQQGGLAGRLGSPALPPWPGGSIKNDAEAWWSAGRQGDSGHSEEQMGAWWVKVVLRVCGGMVCFVGNGLRNCFLLFVRLQLLCLGVKF